MRLRFLLTTDRQKLARGLLGEGAEVQILCSVGQEHIQEVLLGVQESPFIFLNASSQNVQQRPGSRALQLLAEHGAMAVPRTP